MSFNLLLQQYLWLDKIVIINMLWRDVVFKNKQHRWWCCVKMLSFSVHLWGESGNLFFDWVWQRSKFSKWRLHIRELFFQDWEISPLITLLWMTAWLLACRQARSFFSPPPAAQNLRQRRNNNKGQFVHTEVVKMRGCFKQAQHLYCKYF